MDGLSCVARSCSSCLVCLYVRSLDLLFGLSLCEITGPPVWSVSMWDRWTSCLVCLYVRSLNLLFGLSPCEITGPPVWSVSMWDHWTSCLVCLHVRSLDLLFGLYLCEITGPPVRSVSMWDHWTSCLVCLYVRSLDLLFGLSLCEITGPPVWSVSMWDHWTSCLVCLYVRSLNLLFGLSPCEITGGHLTDTPPVPHHEQQGYKADLQCPIPTARYHTASEWRHFLTTTRSITLYISLSSYHCLLPFASHIQVTQLAPDGAPAVVPSVHGEWIGTDAPNPALIYMSVLPVLSAKPVLIIWFDAQVAGCCIWCRCLASSLRYQTHFKRGGSALAAPAV